MKIEATLNMRISIQQDFSLIVGIIAKVLVKPYTNHQVVINSPVNELMVKLGFAENAARGRKSQVTDCKGGRLDFH
jgi:hypothetical protein